jgi:hypothetical protein
MLCSDYLLLKTKSLELESESESESELGVECVNGLYARDVDAGGMLGQRPNSKGISERIESHGADWKKGSGWVSTN